jgi:hypothetical protein
MKKKMNTRVYSAANYAEKCVTSTLKDMTELKDLTESFMYDNFWSLKCVSSVTEESNNTKISFLHPHGLCSSYIHPAIPDILWLPQSAILVKVGSNIAARHIYTSTSEKRKLISEGST